MSPDYMDPERQHGIAREALEDPYQLGVSDTELLDFLVNEGYVSELRRFTDGTWSLNDAFSLTRHEGASWREAVISAYRALRAQPGA